MKIVSTSNINEILDIHQKIFNMDFPVESYLKKCKLYQCLIYKYIEDKKIIGYSIIIKKDAEKELYAWYGGLDPSYQGRGYTNQFFDYLIKYGKDINYDTLTVATSNLRPHMIVFAIKKGFDIYDLKKRETGEGNKIYFMYNLKSKKYQTIDLISNGKNVKPSQIENLIVSTFKSHYSTVYILGCENIKTLIYILKYFESLKYFPIVYVDLEDDIFYYELKKFFKGTIKKL